MINKKGSEIMKCLILLNEEITEEECNCIIVESYKEKNKKELPKKAKRIAGWKVICKNCTNHKPPKK
ncbi:MAG: hypothetical protein K0R15_2831 [Clostridiales bacterium]|jgi:hypothetical protein|nr:hypothetical protein [Clostridiales bacterium]